MPAEPKTSNQEIHWPTVLYYIHLHVLGLYGLLLMFTDAKWLTVFFAFFLILFSSLGITIGAHRLWTHKAFEATGPVKFVLMIAHTLCGVGTIYDWVLAHRTHHQFYGTDRDPYNHKKGFFYSHFVSNLLTPHPDKERIDKDIDMCDVDSDGYVTFQRWFHWILFLIVCLLLPINAPVEYWDESLHNAVYIVGFFRLLVLTHVSWLVNSAALIWGLKPGDKYPVDDNSMFIINKSYWLNYHYLLPWDFKSGEFGSYDRGCSTFFIKSLENLGLIYSLRSPSTEAIRNALYQATSKKSDMTKALDLAKQVTEEEVIKKNLRYSH